MPAKSPETVVLSIRLPAKTKARLEKLAKLSGRSKSWHAAEALDAYIKYQTPIVESLLKARADLDAGRGIPHEEVMARQRARLAALEKRTKRA